MISEETELINEYTSALEKYGSDDYRSLVWADEEGNSSKNRYCQFNEISKFNDKRIIEIGCGWGSFFRHGFNCKEYKGLDVVPQFIEIAKQDFGNHSFELCNFINYSPSKKYDLFISSGVFGDRRGPGVYMDRLKQSLEKSLLLADEVLINFPSTYATIRAEYVEYYSPGIVLELALQLTKNCNLYHKEMNDFILQMKH
jgi:cyclopropane fatty-acyl-phospholipid synthase-like methyltransferase